MSTHDIFSKNVLRKIIEDNLDTLSQCIEGTIYQQWTAVILLMQFIEYVLKYKIQCAGKSFPETHKIKKLYNKLTNDARKDIEDRFRKLMADRNSKYPDRKPEYSDRFRCIKEFGERYNTSYTYWRYDRLSPDFNVDENREGYEKYFYLSDTVTVLRALIESTDLKINLSTIPNEDVLVEKLLKSRM